MPPKKSRLTSKKNARDKYNRDRAASFRARRERVQAGQQQQQQAAEAGTAEAADDTPQQPQVADQPQIPDQPQFVGFNEPEFSFEAEAGPSVEIKQDLEVDFLFFFWEGGGICLNNNFA